MIQQNLTNQLHDGTLIAIRKDIFYTEFDSFNEDMLAINIHTHRGVITIATAYQPPRRPYLLREDFTRLFRRQNATFLLADLNARCRETGYTGQYNRAGQHLENFIHEGLCRRIGPDFPTFIRNNAGTTPDVILTNNAGLPNYWIRQGNPTSSDHQTILMDISWSPIQIPSKPRKQYNKADWNGYAELLQQRCEINLQDGDNTNKIEDSLKRIQTAIQEADQICIPTTTRRMLPHPTYTQVERDLIRQLTQLHQLMANRTATPQTWTQIKQLRMRLNIACKNNSKRVWENKINRIQNTRDPRQFWNQIKRMQGTEDTSQHFIHGENAEKLYLPQEQEPVFRQFWKEIYKEERAPEQLEAAQEALREVETELRQEDVTPDNLINFNNIQGLEISPEETVFTLRTFSQKDLGFDA